MIVVKTVKVNKETNAQICEEIKCNGCTLAESLDIFEEVKKTNDLTKFSDLKIVCIFDDMDGYVYDCEDVK